MHTDIEKQIAVNLQWMSSVLEERITNGKWVKVDEEFLCSIRDDDRSPSCHIYPVKVSDSGSVGCFNDFGGEHGTLTRLAEILGVTPPEYTGKGRKRKTTAPQSQQPQKENCAIAIWNNSLPAKNTMHSYLLAKGVSAITDDLRVLPKGIGRFKVGNGNYITANGQLVARMISADTMKQCGVELISATVDSSGSWGKLDIGIKTGAFFHCGKALSSNVSIVLCEGVSTALSVCEITKEEFSVLACFGASNVPVVAAILAERFPQNEIIIATDNDIPGMNALEETRQGQIGKNGKIEKDGNGKPIRQAVPNALSVRPPKNTPEKTDWNDIHRKYHLEKAREVFYQELERARLFRDCLTTMYSNFEPVINDFSDWIEDEIPPVEWVVEGLVPCGGLTALMADSKRGKSWLAMQIALAVHTGRPLFGNNPFCYPTRGIQVKKGSVLYIHSDTGDRSFRPRLKLLAEGLSKEALKGFKDSAKWGAMDNTGGLEQLINFISDYHPILVVFDVLDDVAPAYSPIGNAYQQDRRKWRPLLELAHRTNTAFLCLAHESKLKHTDFVANMSGSVGLASISDSLLAIECNERPQKGTLAKILRAGRDMIETAPIDIKFDTGWGLATKEEVEANNKNNDNENYSAVIKALQESNEPLKPVEISNITLIPRNSVKQILRRLKEKARVKAYTNGSYILTEKIPN